VTGARASAASTRATADGRAMVAIEHLEHYHDYSESWSE
jgi:hypothetical protein